jgi:quercetin dioxygenase-like cupin family protein
MMPIQGFKIVSPQHGPAYRVANDLVVFKALAAETNGAYSLFEVCTEPGEGTQPHRQRYDDETLWVLEGTYTFQLDQHVVTLGTGGCVYVSRGTLHTFTNSGQVPARLLMLVTPGGIHERFFAEAGETITNVSAGHMPSSRPPDWPRLTSIARKYGIEFVPPVDG